MNHVHNHHNHYHLALHPKLQQLSIDFTFLPIMVVFSHPLKVTLMDAGAKIIFWVNSTYFTRAATAAKQ